MKICQYEKCQKPFEPRKGRPNQKYCSSACRIAASRRTPFDEATVQFFSQIMYRRAQERAQEHAERKAKRAQSPGRLCKYRGCRKPFQPKKPDQVYCGNVCRLAAWRRNGKATPTIEVISPGDLPPELLEDIQTALNASEQEGERR